MASPSVSIGVVAHPSRWEMATNLGDQVEADIVRFDDYGAGERINHIATLAALDRSADWLIMLEDDAIPCEGFREALDGYLSDAPGPVLSLYLGQGRWAGHGTGIRGEVDRLVRDAVASNAHWIASSELWHAVGVAVRTEVVPDLLGWLRKCKTATDDAISAWLRNHSQLAYYTWPSLVDHRDEARLVPTPSNYKRVPRKAYSLLGRD